MKEDIDSRINDKVRYGGVILYMFRPGGVRQVEVRNQLKLEVRLYMMKKDANINTDQRLQQIENNQRKIIEQNNKIISLLGRINSSLINIYRKRQN